MFRLTSAIVILFSGILGAAPIYRADGSSFTIERVPNLTAVEERASDTLPHTPFIARWYTGDIVYTIRSGATGWPVYRLGKGYLIARPEIFWRGDEDPRRLARDFDLTLVEILPTYRLYKFITKSDSVTVAQRIVGENRGFAFPNLVRKIRPTIAVPQDPYYASHQWFLNNTGAFNDAYGKPVTTLLHADIAFEEAIRLLIKRHVEPEKYATKVAIMDSGVVTSHPDLVGDGGKMSPGYDAIRDEEGADPHIPATAGGYELAVYGHGTSCAGIAAAESNDIGVTGVCPWCGIYPVLALEGVEGSAISEEMYLKTYDRFVADPAIAVVNCSFGPTSEYGELPMFPGEEESHLNFMMNGRGGKGGAIVYAAGNDGVNANYDGLFTHTFAFERNGEMVTHRVIVIAATSAWDSHIDYSNWGAEISFSTPSLSSYPVIGIATTTIPGTGDLGGDWTAYFSGTSAAAPVATGVIGFLFSITPELTLEELEEILRVSADKINPHTGFWDENGHSTKFGYGRLNLHKATRRALGLPLCDPLVVSDEIADNRDNDCDGWVDEELRQPFTIGKPCATDNDCAMPWFTDGTPRCLTSFLGYPAPEGYCTVVPNRVPCPDGSFLANNGSSLICIRECNASFPCDRPFFYCSDPVYGRCLPFCKKDRDCPEGHYCDDEAKCRMEPSPTGGPCQSENDCLYNGSYCDTSKPGGYCFTLCDAYNDNQCPDDAKCIYSSRSRSYLCAASCTSDADCRPGEESGYYKCHVSWQDKKGVCFRPCRGDGECINHETGEDNAYCNEEGRCVPYGWKPPEINDTTVTTDETTESDEDTMVTFTLPESSGSDGCALVILSDE